VIFWVVTPCSDVVGYQLVDRPCCLHLLGKTWHPTMTTINEALPRRPRLESSSLSELQVSCYREVVSVCSSGCVSKCFTSETTQRICIKFGIGGST